jgi:tetratricopeptide (TPR) repeat protein
MAGLPMLEVEEPAAPAAETPAAAEAPLDLTFEELPAAAAAEPVAEAEVAQSLEFLDLGEVVATAPTLDELEARVAANPEDWEGHRLLGEALLEAGDRERGVAELDASLAGYDQVEDLESAYAVAEEILRLDPNSVRHQQKRVELAYRQGDRARLVDSYLELADALLRSNDAEKSLAVYQRVLEHDPENVRARSAVETLAPPAPPEPVAPARTTRAPAAPAAAPGEYVDLGAFLLEEEEAPKDTRMRIQDEEPTGDEQLDFQQMLAAFKRGIEANVGEEDFQSHYDLGVAYKEMGLLDEAIAEFQKALRATEGRLKSSEALGLCFFEKGQYAIAETILRRGLELPATGDAERIGLLYWLGRTLEEQQKAPDALAAYNRVFAVDINFADVNQRVAALAGD